MSAPAASSGSLTAIEHMSRFALSLKFDDLPPAIVGLASRYLADSLACALAAAPQAEIRGMTKAFGIESTAGAASSATSRPIWGSSLRATAAHAALCNSSMIRCLDANDLYMPRAPANLLSAGHCSDALGGVLALVDPKINTGQQLICAVVVAYEIQAALSTCIDWIDRGLHSLTQVNFAVPAAAGVLPQYGLTPEVLTNAIALSATTGLCLQGWLKTKSAVRATDSSSSSSSSVGAGAAALASSAVVPSIKFASAGLASSRGVESLDLSRLAGVTGPTDALETLLHFFNPPSRKPELQAFERLGEPDAWTIDRHLVKHLVIRGHSFVCGGVQGSAEAFRPTSQGSADHSTPFVVVMALLNGAFSPHEAYANEAWLRNDIRNHMDKIKLVIDEQFEQARTQGKLGCQMTATKIDGTILSCEQLTTLGHPDAPLSDAQLLSKWDSLLTPVYGPELAPRLWHACNQLQQDCTSGAGGALQALEDILCTLPLASRS